MKKILKSICFLATGINITIMLLATILGNLDLLLLAGASGFLTLFGGLYMNTEENNGR